MPVTEKHKYWLLPIKSSWWSWQLNNGPSLYQMLSEKWNIHCTFYCQLQRLFKKHLCSQNSHYKNMDDFYYERKPWHATTKSTLFSVSKDWDKGEWNTNEDTVKSMKNALNILWFAKRHLEVTLNSKKTKKTIILAIVELYLCVDISQLPSQYKIPFNNFKKICSNFLKAFQVL